MINERFLALGKQRSAIRELFEYGKSLKATMGENMVFDFSLGNPSIPTPDEVTEKIKNIINTTPAASLHGYTSAEGALSVRRAVADHIKKTYSFDAKESLVYMTAGAAAALTSSIAAITQKGDEVIVLAPYFPEYKVFIESLGCKTVEVMTKEPRFHPDIKAIEGAITEKTSAIIINSPNNPTGAVYNEDEIIAIGKLLEEKSKTFGRHIYIISDEPYRELVYDNIETPFIPKFYNDTIVCYSYSKSLSLPGERIGYILVNPSAFDAEDLFASICGAARSMGYVCAPSLVQRLVEECQGLTVDISEYRKNRDLLCQKLQEYGYSFTSPEGAFYLFLKAPENSTLDFFSEAKKRGILLVPSESFGYKGYLRLSYCVDKNMILRALEKFEELSIIFNLKR